MKDSVSNGLYAFPFSDEKYFCPGMTLRDYFAAKALQGMLTQKDASDHSLISTARDAYQYADAMLKAREME